MFVIFGFGPVSDTLLESNIYILSLMALLKGIYDFHFPPRCETTGRFTVSIIYSWKAFGRGICTFIYYGYEDRYRKCKCNYANI